MQEFCYFGIQERTEKLFLVNFFPIIFQVIPKLALACLRAEHSVRENNNQTYTT